MEIEGVSVKIGIKNEFSRQIPAITAGLNNIQKQFTTVSTSVQKSFGSSLAKSFSSLGSNALKGLSSSFSGIGKIVSSSLGSAKNAINSFANSANNSFKGIQSSLSKSFGSVNLSSLKSSLSGVQKSVSNVFSGIKTSLKSVSFSGLGTKIKSSLNSAFTSVKSSAASLGSTLKSKLTSAFSGVGEKIKSSLSTVKTSIQSVASAAQNGFNKIVSAGKSVEKQMGLIGTAITAVFTKKLVSAIESATSIFMTFDDQMRKVQAVTESTGEQFEALTTQAKYLGATTSFTAQDAAEAMTFLGQAGFNSTQIIAAMPATLNLARASMTELGTTADIMSNIMNGFQISAENTGRASDVLSKAANATNTDVTGLGQAMKYAAPLAHQMSWSLEETAAAAGMLSNAGIKADMAGTVLRNSITRLIAPTDKTVTLLAKYGISMDMVNPKVYSLAQILDTLTAAGVSSGDMMSVFGMRAGPGMMALVNQGTTALKNMNQTLIDSGGYAQKAADEMDAGWGGVVRLLGDTVEALQLSFGSALANILTPFAKAVSVVGYAISQLPSPIIYMASALALAGVAAGAFLVSMAALPTVVSVLSAGIGVFSSGLVTLSMGIVKLSLAGGMVGSIFSGLVTAITSVASVLTGPVILGITVVGAALYELEAKTQIFTKTWETLKDLWTIGTYYIGKAFDELKYAVSNAVDSIIGYLHDLIDDTWIGSFVDTLTSAYEKISSVFGDARSSIHNTAESIREEDAKQAESAKNVQSQIESAHNGVVTSYQTVDKETGQTYASMIEDADSMSEGVTSANGEVISSNNDLISSNQAVTASSPKISYTLEQTDIGSIADPSKGKSFVTADTLNNGMELADGSMLKFNESGQIVIETLDGIQTRLYDIGNTSLETNDNKKIWTITDNYTETDGKYVNTGPAKTVSLADAKAATEEEESYQKSPGDTAAQWAEQHPNDTTVYVNEKSGAKGTRQLTEHEKELVASGEWTAPISEMPDTGSKTSKSRETLNKEIGVANGLTAEQAGTTPTKEVLPVEYLRARKWNDLKWDNIKSKISSKILPAKTNKPSQYDWTKEQLSGFELPDVKTSVSKALLKINKPIASTAGLQSASFAPDLSGIVGKYDAIKKKIQELDSLKFDGLKASIQGYADKIKESASNIPGVKSTLETLNGVSYEGIKGSIQGYVSKFADSVSQIPTLKSTLESINSISYEGLKSTIQGYMTKFSESVSQNPTVKSALESLNSISYEGLKTSIQGYISKFLESASQIPGVKSILETINSVSYEGLKSTVQGVENKFWEAAAQIPGVKSVCETLNSVSYEGIKGSIQGIISKFWDTISTIPGVKGAISSINNISFSGILSSIGTVSSALSNLIESAKNMYNRVKEYVSGADSLNSSGGHSSNKSATPSNNITNIKVNSIIENGHVLFADKLKKAGL